MSYKPGEKDFMAYLYNELEGQDKEKFERYLLEHPDAQKELASFQQLRSMLGEVEDKEVIAPPIVIGETGQRFIWHTPYFRTIVSIAASLILIILVGKYAGVRANFSSHEFKIGFGEPVINKLQENQAPATLTATEVQNMINTSLTESNTAMQANWQQTQQQLDASIRKNLAVNSGKINELVQEASSASQAQIREYVSGIQSENTQLVKDYFQLTSTEQKKYIENLLVDFAKYLQQQRNDDLQLVQSRLNNIEQNTDLFKQETEQILSSIITSVGNTTNPVSTSGTRY